MDAASPPLLSLSKSCAGRVKVVLCLCRCLYCQLSFPYHPFPTSQASHCFRPLSLSRAASLLPDFSYWISPPWTSIPGRLGNRTCAFPLFSWGMWDSSALSSRTHCEVPTNQALTNLAAPVRRLSFQIAALPFFLGLGPQLSEP